MAGGGMMAALRLNQRLYKEIYLLFFLLPENDPMELKDIKALSTAQLTKLYNEHAEKAVTRFATRQKAEERAIALLKSKSLLDGEPANSDTPPADGPAAKPAKAKASRKPIEAPLNPEPENDKENDMAKATAKKAAAKKAPAKKAAAATPKATGAQRGAKLTNLTYKAISEKSKNFNPRGFKMQGSSARAVVIESIRKAENGKTRKQLESQFEGQNVKAALDFLVKYGFATASEA